MSVQTLRFRIALKKVMPFCSRPLLAVLHTVLGQESSSNYSLGDIQLHLTITAKRRVASKRINIRKESFQMLTIDGKRRNEEIDVIEEKGDSGDAEGSVSLTLDELA